MRQKVSFWLAIGIGFIILAMSLLFAYVQAF